MAQLLEEVGSAELVEWAAFARLEPFGAEIEDFRSGLMPALTINMNRKEGSEPVAPMDLYAWHKPAEKPTPEPETPDQLAARIRREIFKVEE